MVDVQVEVVEDNLKKKSMRNYFIKILLVSSIYSFGQNINDAIRYSQTDLSGTARFTGMSGAFGALGADLSAVTLNPAGSTFFNNNHAGITLRNFNVNNNANYFGTKNSEIKSSLDISQAGGVFVFENAKKSDWSKIAVTINYESTANFDNQVISKGVGNYSVGNYFLSYANTGNNGNPIPLEFVTRLPNESIGELYEYLGTNLGNQSFAAQQAMLAYYGQSYIIDATDLSNPNSSYFSLVPTGANYVQKNEFESTGFNGKLTLNGAIQYKDFISFGLNINSHFVDYTQVTTFTERNDYVNTNLDYTVRDIQFNNELYTYGTGISVQLGTIIKPVKQLRIGLSYQSPTWYRLNDELTQSLSAQSINLNGEIPREYADPGVTLVYEPYKVRTAGNFSGSLAYIFGKKGVLSFDCIYKNQDGIKLGPKSDFSSENDYITDVLKNTFDFRLGGEYKIQKFSLRGGYRFEESPYENGRTIGDLTGYSGGIGYNFGKIKLDASYVYSQRFYDQQFFTQGFTDYSTVNSKNHSISTTVTFEF